MRRRRWWWWWKRRRTGGGLREDRVVGALTVEDHLLRARVPHDDRHALPRRVEREHMQHLRTHTNNLYSKFLSHSPSVQFTSVQCSKLRYVRK